MRERQINFDATTEECKGIQTLLSTMSLKTESAQSGENKWPGYVAFNGIFLFVIGFNLLFGGLSCFPSKFGIYAKSAYYCLVTYYIYTFLAARSELKEGSRWRYFSENFFLFRIMREYLRLDYIVSKALEDAEKKKDSQFIFAIFPHGTASDYRILMDGILHKVFPNISEKIKVLAASVLFGIPIVRELALWTGCVDARRSVAENVLQKGHSMVVLPGGEAEQLRTIYQQERVYLKSRKGFVKLAMRKGVPIVPAYVFGASDYYYTSNLFFGPRLWLQKNLGLCIPLAAGLWGSIFCPLPVKTTIVFGEPLSCQMKEKGNPTNEELNAAHEEFCKALRHVFDSHKHVLGYGDRELEVL
jgi:1-acyl-sn-glycerol-3-phosphate acyltransferase